MQGKIPSLGEDSHLPEYWFRDIVHVSSEVCWKAPPEVQRYLMSAVLSLD